MDTESTKTSATSEKISSKIFETLAFSMGFRMGHKYNTNFLVINLFFVSIFPLPTIKCPTTPRSSTTHTVHHSFVRGVCVSGKENKVVRVVAPLTQRMSQRPPAIFSTNFFPPSPLISLTFCSSLQPRACSRLKLTTAPPSYALSSSSLIAFSKIDNIQHGANQCIFLVPGIKLGAKRCDKWNPSCSTSCRSDYIHFSCTHTALFPSFLLVLVYSHRRIMTFSNMFGTLSTTVRAQQFVSSIHLK